jgi:hypothetical protein
MSIRTRIFGPGADDPLISVKKPKGAKTDALDSVLVRRTECRRGNARSCDRYRLSTEEAIIRFEAQEFAVELVNLSARGAMIRGRVELHLWDEVGLVLGEGGELDCAVRWIKDGCVGLEFADETRIDCDKDARDEILRAVVRKSFPELAEIALEYPKRRAGDDPEDDAESGERREAGRHPLVWNGVIYYADSHDYEAEPVRLRNISVTGALVQAGNSLPEGETVYLDLRSAGRHAATVQWTRGDLSGLQFHDLFDIHSLSGTRPEIAPPTAEADFDQPESGAWSVQSSIVQLPRIRRQSA